MVDKTTSGKRKNKKLMTDGGEDVGVNNDSYDERDRGVQSGVESLPGTKEQMETEETTIAEVNANGGLESTSFGGGMTEDEQKMLEESIRELRGKMENPELLDKALEGTAEIRKGIDKPWTEKEINKNANGAQFPLRNAKAKEEYGVNAGEDKSVMAFSQNVFNVMELENGTVSTVPHELMHAMHRELGFDDSATPREHNEIEQTGVYNDRYHLTDFMLKERSPDKMEGMNNTTPVTDNEPVQKGEQVMTPDGDVGIARPTGNGTVQVGNKEYEQNELERSNLDNEQFVDNPTELTNEPARVVIDNNEYYGFVNEDFRSGGFTVQHPTTDESRQFSEDEIEEGRVGVYQRTDYNVNDQMVNTENIPGAEQTKELGISPFGGVEDQDWNTEVNVFEEAKEGDYIHYGSDVLAEDEAGKVTEVTDGSITVVSNGDEIELEEGNDIIEPKGYIDGSVNDVNANTKEEELIGQANISWYKSLAEENIVGEADHVYDEVSSEGAAETLAVLHGQTNHQRVSESETDEVRKNHLELMSIYEELYQN